MEQLTKNYTLGRGELHFGQFRPDSQVPKGFLYLGNTPEFNLTIESERLDHFNSDRGVREKDDSVVLQSNRTGSLITDNISYDNLSYFFLGEALTTTIAASTALSDTFLDVETRRTYQLGITEATPSGTRSVTNVVVADDVTPTPTTFVAGTDYVVDLEAAIVTPLEGGAIVDGTNLVITYDQGASTRDRMISKSATIEGALQYRAKNPKGKQIDYLMPWVQISPNGDFSIKAEEWQQLPFTIEILKKGNLEAIYADGRPYTPA